MQTTNTILEDIGAEIGFTATSALVGWYGGRFLYIPRVAVEHHAIAKVIGLRQFAALVKGFGGTDIFVPKDWHSRRLRRDRVVFDLLKKGTDPKIISHKTGISSTHVSNIRRTLEEVGLLPFILTVEQQTDDC